MSENTLTFEGSLDATGLRIGIVAARFNDFIVERLLSGAVDALQKHGASGADIEIVRVPGAFEMPLAVKKLAASRRYDAIIALGCVIRGATPHFDIVAGESAKALASLSLTHSLPVINAILTTDTIEQSIERAGTKAGNKGGDAAMSAMEMISLMRKIPDA